MKSILIIYADQHPNSNVETDDVLIKRMSLTAYRTQRQLIRGHSFLAVILDGVTEDDLQEDQESYKALVNAMVSHKSEIVVARDDERWTPPENSAALSAGMNG